MKNSILTLLLSVALAATLQAGTHKLPEDEPFVSVTLPEKWEVSEIDNGIEATSDDEEVYLAIETTDADNVEAMIDEAVDFLGKEGVTVDEKSMKKNEGKINGMESINISWSGNDKEGPAVIALTIVVVGDDEGLLFTYWASPAGAKKHDSALDAIAQSIEKIDG